MGEGGTRERARGREGGRERESDGGRKRDGYKFSLSPAGCHEDPIIPAADVDTRSPGLNLHPCKEKKVGIDGAINPKFNFVILD